MVKSFIILVFNELIVSSVDFFPYESHETFILRINRNEYKSELINIKEGQVAAAADAHNWRSMKFA